MTAKKSIIPYPGGKARKADWITDVFPPDYKLYCEPFGGSAAVLCEKDPSTIEVYNDRDSELAHFFETLRDRTDDLAAWLGKTPYSRRLHEKYLAQFYDGDPADMDDVERAGVFFYLRYTQFGRKYHGTSGFATSTTRNEARTYSNARDELDRFADRFQDVLIECLDWKECLEKYDGEKTLFYLDPPYLGTESNYLVDDFSHAELAKTLPTIEGRAVVSYQDIPDVFDPDDWFVLERGDHSHMGSGHNGTGTSRDSAKEVTERLLLNFDPDVPGARTFEGTPQASLGDW